MDKFEVGKVFQYMTNVVRLNRKIFALVDFVDHVTDMLYLGSAPGDVERQLVKAQKAIEEGNLRPNPLARCVKMLEPHLANKHAEPGPLEMVLESMSDFLNLDQVERTILGTVVRYYNIPPVKEVLDLYLKNHNAVETIAAVAGLRIGDVEKRFQYGSQLMNTDIMDFDNSPSSRGFAAALYV